MATVVNFNVLKNVSKLWLFENIFVINFAFFSEYLSFPANMGLSPNLNPYFTKHWVYLTCPELL